MNVTHEYQVSPRVVLRPGDKFRVAGGPYYRLAGGTKVEFGARGVLHLLEVRQHRGRVEIVAYSEQGVAVLHVAGRRRNRWCPQIVCRPYRVTKRVR